MTDREILLGHIAEFSKDGVMRGDRLCFDCGAEVTAEILNRTAAANGMCSAEAAFRVFHPLFDVPVEDNAAGVGKDMDEAFRNSAASFAGTVLANILAVFGCTDGVNIGSSVTGERITFRRACISPVMSIGAEPSQTDMWEKLKREIPPYLGGKKQAPFRLTEAVRAAASGTRCGISRK